jgi:O-antigen/teichoic acid export membrane protein
MLSIALLSRSMGEAALAHALIVLSFMAAAGPLTVLGFDTALLRARGARSLIVPLARRFALVWSVIAGLMGIAAVSFGPGDWLAAWLGVRPLLLVAWLALVAAQSFLSALLLALGRCRCALLFGGTLSSGVVCLAIAIFPAAGTGLSGLAAVQLAGLGLSIAAGMAVVRRAMAEAGPARPLSPNWGDIASGALTNAVAVVAGQLPLWMVAALGTQSQTVDLGLAMRLVLPLGFVLVAARAMAAPVLATARSGGWPAQAGGALCRIARVAALASVALALCIVVLARPVTEALFARVPADAALLIGLLGVGPCLQAAIGPGQLALRIAGGEAEALVIAAGLLAGLAVGAGVGFLLLGPAGVALAASTHLALGSAIPAWRFTRRSGVRLGAVGPCA